MPVSAIGLEGRDMRRLRIKARIGYDEGAREITFIGRDAWALRELIKAGEQGCTPIDNPGPRWSGYILKLRKAGVLIQTKTEPHGGEFSGAHARYVLRSKVQILEASDGDTGDHVECLERADAA